MVNPQIENSEKEAVRKQLGEIDVDLSLLIEVDQAWDNALKPLADDYPYREGVIREKGLGIMLRSRFPLIESEAEYSEPIRKLAPLAPPAGRGAAVRGFRIGS